MTPFTLLLFAIMVLFYTLQSLLTRKYSDHYPGDPALASPVFTIVSGLVVVLFSVVMCRFQFEASWPTWLMGLANGVALVLYNTCIIKASQTGPYSVLMVFNIAGGIVIPILCGIVLFGDTITPLKALCILAALISGYFISVKDNETRRQKGFWAASIGLGIANGLYGTFLDAQQRVTGAEQKEEMIAITFGTAVLISAAVLVLKEKKQFLPAMKQNKRSALYLIACSLIVAGAIYMLTLMIGLMDLAILYTFDTSSVLMLSVLCSWLFFKEKLSKKNVIGCIAMCIALICMGGSDIILGWFQ